MTPLYWLDKDEGGAPEDNPGAIIVWAVIALVVWIIVVGGAIAVAVVRGGS